MKKIFVIPITILLLVGVIVCIFVMKPKEVSTIPENSVTKVGELEDGNALADNIQYSKEVTTGNTEMKNSINESTSANKETEKNTNTLTNTTSSNKNNTEEKNKTTTNTQTSTKPNNTNKGNSTTSNKTTTTTNTTTNKTASSTNSNSSSSKTTTTNNTKKEEQHKHFMGVNVGWFKTENEAYNRFKTELEKWDQKYYAGEITWDELGKYCPIRI